MNEIENGCDGASDKMEIKADLHSTAILKDVMEATVVRSSPSWSYIYITLGFAITIIGTILTMIPQERMPFPYNVGLFSLLIVGLVYFFVFNGKFQNCLFRLEQWYEKRAR